MGLVIFQRLVGRVPFQVKIPVGRADLELLEIEALQIQHRQIAPLELVGGNRVEHVGVGDQNLIAAARVQIDLVAHRGEAADLQGAFLAVFLEQEGELVLDQPVFLPGIRVVNGRLPIPLRQFLQELLDQGAGGGIGVGLGQLPELLVPGVSRRG